MEIKKEPGTIDDPNDDLSVAQERVSLVKSLICRTAKLETEVLEKDASLEQLRREMAEMKNILKMDDAITQSLTSRFQEEKLALEQKIERQEEEKRTLKIRLGLQESESAAMSKRFAQEERRLRAENLGLQQKLDLEVKHRAAVYRHVSEAKSLLDANGGEVAQIPSKNQAAVQYTIETRPSGERILKLQHVQSQLKSGIVRMVQQPQPVIIHSTPVQPTFVVRPREVQTGLEHGAPGIKKPRIMMLQQNQHRKQ